MNKIARVLNYLHFFTQRNATAMVQFTLSLKADLENVSLLQPDASIDWKIKFRCSHCNEVKENFVDVNGQEQLENPHGRGTTNLIMKCKFCKRDMTVDVITSKACRPLTPEDNGKFVPVIVFECRGTVPIEFQPANGWTCRGVKSSKVFNVELHEDWADYDDEANESVGIYNVGYQIE